MCSSDLVFSVFSQDVWLVISGVNGDRDELIIHSIKFAFSLNHIVCNDWTYIRTGRKDESDYNNISITCMK